VLDRMKESKAAAVLAAMSPDRARDATLQLALTRTRAATASETGGKSAPSPSQGKPPASGT
jgi:flagellar motility protein MotE (MotC chaperone)